MVDVLVQDEHAALVEPLDDLGVGLVHIHAAPRAAVAERVAHIELAVVIDRHDNRDVELHAGVVVVHAMAGSAMDDAGAVFQGYVVGVDELAQLALVAEDGLLVLVAGKVGTGHCPLRAVGTQCQLVGPAEALAALLHQIACHNGCAAFNHNGHVFRGGVQDNAGVGGKRPGRGGPDGHVQLTLVSLEPSGDGGHFEAHEDSRAYLVAVLDLGFGQSGMAMAAPVNGLASAVHAAVEVELLEDLDVAGLVFGQIGEVRVVPLAAHAQALEALALAIELLGCVFAADLAEGGGVDLRHLLFAELLFHLVLDGKAVAVPTGNVRSVVAAHGLVLHDEVFEDLVEGMADMDGAVSVGRAVMQDEGLVVLVLFQNLCVNIDIVPILKALRFVLGQVRAHREVGARQIHGLLVAVGHGATFLHPCLQCNQLIIAEQAEEAAGGLQLLRLLLEPGGAAFLAHGGLHALGLGAGSVQHAALDGAVLEVAPAREDDVALIHQLVVRGIQADPVAAIEHLDPSMGGALAFHQAGAVASRNALGAAQHDEHLRVILAHAGGQAERLARGGLHRGGTAIVGEVAVHRMHQVARLLHHGRMGNALQDAPREHLRLVAGLRVERRLQVHGMRHFGVGSLLVHHNQPIAHERERIVRLGDAAHMKAVAEPVGKLAQVCARRDDELGIQDLLERGGTRGAAQHEVVRRYRLRKLQVRLERVT